MPRYEAVWTSDSVLVIDTKSKEILSVYTTLHPDRDVAALRDVRYLNCLEEKGGSVVARQSPWVIHLSRDGSMILRLEDGWPFKEAVVSDPLLFAKQIQMADDLARRAVST